MRALPSLLLTLTLLGAAELPARAQEGAPAGPTLPADGPAALAQFEASLNELGQLRGAEQREAAKAKRAELKAYAEAFLGKFPGQVPDAELERVMRVFLAFGGQPEQAFAALEGASGLSAGFKGGLAALRAFLPVDAKIGAIFRARRERKSAEEIDKIRDEVYALLGPWLDAHAKQAFAGELVRGLGEWTFQARRKGQLEALEARMQALREVQASLPEPVQGMIVEFFLRPGQPAPAFSGKALDDGREVTLASLKGKLVLLDFWAAWCRPCLALQKRSLLPLYERYKGQEKFALVGLGLGKLGRLEDTLEAERAAAEKLGAHWLKVFDAEGAAAKAYGVGQGPDNQLPYLVLIDEEGKILVKGLGHRAIKAIEAELAKRFGGPAPTPGPSEDEPGEGE